MKLNVVMPELGEGVVEGELQKWCVKQGDFIKEDDIIAEVTTDKASVEIPSTVSGKVKELKFKTGDTCPVGKALLTVEGVEKTKVEKSSHTSLSADVFAQNKTEIKKDSITTSAAASETFTKTDPTILATPLVRKLAQKHSIDLHQIKGTGLAGRVTLDDLPIPKEASTRPALSQDQKQASNLEERKPLKGVRKKNCRANDFIQANHSSFYCDGVCLCGRINTTEEKGQRDLSRRENYLFIFYYENFIQLSFGFS